MSAEYDAALEVKDAIYQCEQSIDCITVRLPTLRERAAIAAMQGLLADPNWNADNTTGGTLTELTAITSVAMADALIAELAKKGSA